MRSPWLRPSFHHPSSNLSRKRLHQFELVPFGASGTGLPFPKAFVSSLRLLKSYTCGLEACVFAQLLVWVEFGSDWN